MIASLYQNGSTLVGVSLWAMRLIFDAQTARRNHRFVDCYARHASSSQNRSGHVAVAAYKNVCVNVLLPFKLHYLARDTLPLTSALHPSVGETKHSIKRLAILGRSLFV